MRALGVGFRLCPGLFGCMGSWQPAPSCPPSWLLKKFNPCAHRNGSDGIRLAGDGRVPFRHCDPGKLSPGCQTTESRSAFLVGSRGDLLYRPPRRAQGGGGCQLPSSHLSSRGLLDSRPQQLEIDLPLSTRQVGRTESLTPILTPIFGSPGRWGYPRPPSGVPVGPPLVIKEAQPAAPAVGAGVRHSGGGRGRHRVPGRGPAARPLYAAVCQIVLNHISPRNPSSTTNPRACILFGLKACTSE